MKYKEGQINKVYILKFDHGENFLEELNKFVIEKNIKSGIINFIGALDTGKIVQGPKKIHPLEPFVSNFDVPKETVGTGTIFWSNKEPKIHIHGLFGDYKESFFGCLRGNANVFLIIEAIIYELDIQAKRMYDEKTKLELLNLD
ncbi:hypothetical protein BVX95_00450 [archaeon D22]|nr:hypothetical protein BVX95_00450 [archaeon D22]